MNKVIHCEKSPKQRHMVHREYEILPRTLKLLSANNSILIALHTSSYILDHSCYDNPIAERILCSIFQLKKITFKEILWLLP